MTRILFILIIFFSAFLLFQVQPMQTKALLPLFGGGASIWSASLCFFQSALLLGYIYAHLLARLPFNKQAITHMSLLFVALLITFNFNAAIDASFLSPALLVIANLIVQIGLVFVLLSATSVLLQRWYSEVYNEAVPYSWYAFSNSGSLLALLTYPLLIEANFALSQQKQLWLITLMLLACGFTALLFSLHKQLKQTGTVGSHFVRYQVKLNAKTVYWVALSAASSMCLVATTQMISTNIPPMPLIWLMPLVLYLVTYIVCFTVRTNTANMYWLAAMLFAMIAGQMMYFVGGQLNTLAQLVMYHLILIICCGFCHARLRQSAPEKLRMTEFYMCIAFGGALGSIFASLVAPNLFTQLWEYPIALILTFLLFITPLIKHYQFSVKSLALSTCSLSIVVSFIWLNSLFNQFNIDTARNFYGYVAVKDIKTGQLAERRLVDGTTVHGSELIGRTLAGSKDYYHASTGVAETLKAIKQIEPLNIGVIGLGVGAMAKLMGDNDTITFYEINPAVYRMATQHFSYLQNSQATLNIELGDGRLLLAKEAKTDLPLRNAIVIDAFTSDVIPTHLLTHEAFNLYWQRLSDKGALILHISNNHIDLMPVITAHANRLNKPLLVFDYQSNSATEFASKWVVLTKNTTLMAKLAVTADKIIKPSNRQNLAMWSDDKNSVMPLLKLGI